MGNFWFYFLGVGLHQNPDPQRFAPAGILGEVAWPEGVRVDTWVESGSHVTPYYDSLLAKLMVFAPTRPEAIAKLVDALSKTKV